MTLDLRTNSTSHTVLLAFPKIESELFCDLRKKVTSQGEQKGKKMKEEMIAKKYNWCLTETPHFHFSSPRYKAVLYKRNQWKYIYPSHLLVSVWEYFETSQINKNGRHCKYLILHINLFYPTNFWISVWIFMTYTLNVTRPHYLILSKIYVNMYYRGINSFLKLKGQFLLVQNPSF